MRYTYKPGLPMDRLDGMLRRLDMNLRSIPVIEFGKLDAYAGKNPDGTFGIVIDDKPVMNVTVMKSFRHVVVHTGAYEAIIIPLKALRKTFGNRMKIAIRRRQSYTIHVVRYSANNPGETYDNDVVIKSWPYPFMQPDTDNVEAVLSEIARQAIKAPSATWNDLLCLDGDAEDAAGISIQPSGVDACVMVDMDAPAY